MTRTPGADDSDPIREAVHDALRQFNPDSILTSWVVVCEWVTPDGSRALGTAHAATTTPWTAKGMLFEVMFGNQNQWERRDDE